MSSSEINTILQAPQRKHCLVAGGVSDAEKGVLHSLHFTVLLAEKKHWVSSSFSGQDATGGSPQNWELKQHTISPSLKTGSTDTSTPFQTEK